ncbi:iron ABC transporter permease [Calidifontibacter sp. DB0510]|uniref:Iron ABC transporter permease n=2 Tax=Metallococcus carri TaxID=1656884 RepID=A0A967E8Z6_9MICO|nr:iron ABC transporter permease [Metallococcus carri]NOP37035.1 iron ABC transporter permease [Calidifontibacter sp. DB2511S]
MARLIFRGRVRELLGNTVQLVGVAVPLCLVIGIGAALAVERVRLPLRGLAAALLAAPLAVPAFVNSYAWATVWPGIGGLRGAVLISVLSYYPFVYIPVLAALRRLDPAVEESARSLGLSGPAVVWRVVLPQLRLPALGGALLVAVHLLAEYGAFAFVRFDTFTTAIYDQYRTTFAGPAAAALSAVLVLLCLLLLVLEAGTRGRERYERIGGGAAARVRPVRLGAGGIPVALGILAVLGAALGVPAWSLTTWLTARGGEWTAELPTIVWTTLRFSLLAGLLTTVAALPLAWLSVRRPGRWTRALEGTTFVATSLPGIVVALALVTLSLDLLPAVYQTSTLLVFAYAVLFLPRALVTVRAGLAQAPRRLEEIAMSLGCPRWLALVRVTIPILAPALLGSIALAFLGAAGELSATLLLAPTGTDTLATRFWSLSNELDYAGAAPYALLLVVLSLPMTYLLYRQSREDG